MRKKLTSRKSGLTRREFVAAAAAASAFSIVPRHVLGGPGYTPPSEKLNIAGIGVGGHGAFLIGGIGSENRDAVNIVALCDVDEQRASDTIVRRLPAVTNDGGFKRFPEARRYNDFRKLLDWEEKNIDAVVVATPDHTHIPISVMAMKMGKHVYCEKPLAHNIFEARLAAEVAREKNLVTQMGIGNHASESFRRVVELIRAGTIGEVREVHAWCDDDEGMPPDDGTLAWGDRQPQHGPPVPETLHWDLWLGPAPYRPYHPAYHPIVWRNWWDFGNGRLGDMGCHLLDLAFWALDLKHPLTAEAEGPRVGHEVTPKSLTARWTFAARSDLPSVELTWYHGGKRPELSKEVDLPNWPIAVLFVGTEGMLITAIEVLPIKSELHPKAKFTDFQPPPQTIPRSIGHYREWIEACRTGRSTTCGFDYSGPLTETVLLGNVAYRTGEKLQWNAKTLKATNCPEADQYIRREYRSGWAL